MLIIVGKQQFFCTYCKVPGHSNERCFKLHGYPPNFKGFKDRKAATVTSQNDTSERSTIFVSQYNQLLDLLKKQQPSFGTGQNENPQGSQNLFADIFCLSFSLHTGWILDSGATYHICSILDFFSNYKVCDEPDRFITVPDGRRIQINHIGDIILTKDITLHNVFHASDFKFNLISVQSLCRDLITV